MQTASLPLRRLRTQFRDPQLILQILHDIFGNRTSRVPIGKGLGTRGHAGFLSSTVESWCFFRKSWLVESSCLYYIMQHPACEPMSEHQQWRQLRDVIQDGMRIAQGGGKLRRISDVKHCLPVDVAGLGATLRVLQVSKCAIERGLNHDSNLVQISKNIHKEACKAHNQEVPETRFSQEADRGPQEVLVTHLSSEEACPAQIAQDANVAQQEVQRTQLCNTGGMYSRLLVFLVFCCCCCSNVVGLPQHGLHFNKTACSLDALNHCPTGCLLLSGPRHGTVPP